MNTKQICILILSLALLAAFIGTGFSMQETTSLDSSCCDEECVEINCNIFIQMIYNACDFSMIVDGKKMSYSDAKEYCKTDSNWICIFTQTSKASDCYVGCHEGEWYSECGLQEDEDTEGSDNFCSNVKENLQDQCEISTKRSGDDDDDDDLCG